MNSIKVCEYSRSRSFHDDLILQDQASGERSQDQWSSGFQKKANARGFRPLIALHYMRASSQILFAYNTWKAAHKPQKTI